MIWVLDTDILTLLGRDDSREAPRIRRRIVELPLEDIVVTSIINYEEQMRGWMAALSRAKSLPSQVATYSRLLDHLGTFRRMTVLPFNDSAAAHFEKLRRQRLSIGTMDLKIASIVLAFDGALVTRNLTDFKAIPGLRSENWSAS
jgi:tRNA(fMet)-specific endonuclease VapC